MADRYWVGGTGTWSTTNTVNWSATSGGAGGASVPTATDNVFINGSSGVGTVTTATGATCANFNCTGYTGTFNSVTFGLAVTGDFILAAGMTLTASSQFSLQGGTGTSITVNTAGKTLGGLSVGNLIAGYDGTRTLAAALACGTLTFHSGTFDTAGFAVTATAISSSASTQSRTLTLGASTITLSGTSPINFGTPTNANLTLNAGTSTITCNSGGTVTFQGAGKTFYNVRFTSTATSGKTIDGANTFNDLYLANRGGAGWNYFVLNNDIVVNGTLTLTGFNIATNRTQLRASAAASLFTTARTITAAAFASGSTDWDFCGIVIAGAAAPISGTRFGDAGGAINSGITFDTPKTVYKNGTGTTGTTSNAWSNTSGGAGNNIYFPLAQDTAIFDNNSNATFATVANQLIGTFDFSARTTALTFNVAFNTEVFKDLILDNNVTVSTTTTRFFFFGSNNQSFNGGGISITCGVTVGKSAGTLTLASAVTQGATATLPFTVQSGTVDFGSYSHSFVQLASTDTTYSPTLTFGGGSVTIPSTSTTPFNLSNSNATVTGTGSVYATNTGTGARTFTATPTGCRYLDFYVTGGSGNTSFNGTVGKIDYYNGGTGTYTGNFGNTGVSVYGDFKLKSGMGWSVQANTVTLKGGSGTNTIDFAGVAGGCPITFNNTEGGGWVLASAYSTSNATSLLNGSLNLAGFSTTSGSFSFQNSPSLEFNGATLTLTGSGTVWNVTGTPTVTNVSGTATVSLTSASTKTFAGANLTYPITLNQGGAGTLIVTGSNKFNDITNSVIATVQFAAGVTNEFLTGFNLNGASGNLLTLTSTTGVQTTLKKSTTWYMGANSTNVSNNTGLTFTAGGGIDYLAVSNINGTNGGTTYDSTISETALGYDLNWFIAAQTFAVSLSETTTGTDSVSASFAFNSDVSESATGTESVSAAVTFETVVVDSATGSDSISSSFSFSSSISESATGTDSVSVVLTLGAAISETGTGSDTVSAVPVYSRSIAETATGTETVSTKLTFVSAVAETGSGTDQFAAITVISRSVVETATVTDTTAAAMVAYSQLAESATLTDAASAVLSVVATISESATGSDVVSGARGFYVDVSETATTTDTFAALKYINRAVVESSTASDVTTTTFVALAVIQEQVSGSDSTTTTLSAVSLVAESSTATDTVTVALTLPAEISEAGTGTDLVSAVRTLNGVLDETATGTDAVDGALSLYTTVSETATGADVLLAGFFFSSVVAETASGTDTVFAVSLVNAAVAESGTGADALSTALTAYSTVQETVTGTDVVLGGIGIFVTVAESATLSDLVAGGYLWNLIDDSQAGSWGVISNTQSAGWGVVDDSQNPNWQNVDTL